MSVEDISDVIFAITELDVEKFAELAKKGVDLKWEYLDDGNNPFLVAMKLPDASVVELDPL